MNSQIVSIMLNYCNGILQTIKSYNTRNKSNSVEGLTVWHLVYNQIIQYQEPKQLGIAMGSEKK